MSIPEPAVLNLEATSGEAFSQELQFKSTPSGAALDLRGYQLRAQLRNPESLELVGEFTISALDWATGRFALALSSAQVAQAAPEALWDLLVVQSGGQPRVWLLGTLTVS